MTHGPAGGIRRYAASAVTHPRLPGLRKQWATTTIVTRRRDHLVADTYDVLVIGAGGAGLRAAGFVDRRRDGRP